MIDILSQSLINPPEASWQELSDPFRLGPLDSLVTPTIPIAVVFLYAGSKHSKNEQVVPTERLRSALESVLHLYPHLTGRLQVDITGGSPSITRFGTGASFVVAECSRTLESFIAGDAQTLSLSDLPEGGNELLTPFNPTLETLNDTPMLSIQHTRFACGSVSLGIRILHTVCDAEGYFQFVRHLAKTYRGEKCESPRIGSYLAGIDETMSLAEREGTSSALYHLEAEGPVPQAESGKDQTSEKDNHAVQKPSNTTGRFMRFSGSELAAIKSEATNADGASWISTFDALSAHLYHHVHRARLSFRAKDASLPALSPSDFLTPINVRSRVSPDAFPANYFPNALITAITEIPPDILTNGPLWRIAEIIHKLTRTSALTSKTDLEATTKWIAAQPDKRRIVQDFRFGDGVFMCSQWTRFDMYGGCRFEDEPILVAPPFTIISLIDGLGYLLPTGGEDAAEIEVCLALRDELWGLLEEDQEFRRFR